MKPRIQKDESIIFPMRGKPPECPDGYIRDPHDPYHFYKEEHHAKKFRQYTEQEKRDRIRTVKLICLDCDRNPRKHFFDVGTIKEATFCSECKLCGTSKVGLIWQHCPLNKFKAITGD